jgi:hypothetical protein
MTAQRRLVLGDPLPPVARGDEPIEVGWHPTCGHVRHISIHHRLDGTFSPGLTYGVLPNNEARRRIGECESCRPLEQMKFGGGGLR